MNNRIIILFFLVVAICSCKEEFSSEYNQGYSKGYEIGYQKAFEKAEKTDFNKYGFDKGFREGFNQGLEKGDSVLNTRIEERIIDYKKSNIICSKHNELSENENKLYESGFLLDSYVTDNNKYTLEFYGTINESIDNAMIKFYACSDSDRSLYWQYYLRFTGFKCVNLSNLGDVAIADQTGYSFLNPNGKIKGYYKVKELASHFDGDMEAHLNNCFSNDGKDFYTIIKSKEISKSSGSNYELVALSSSGENKWEINLNGISFGGSRLVAKDSLVIAGENIISKNGKLLVQFNSELPAIILDNEVYSYEKGEVYKYSFNKSVVKTKCIVNDYSHFLKSSSKEEIYFAVKALENHFVEADKKLLLDLEKIIKYQKMKNANSNSLYKNIYKDVLDLYSKIRESNI